MRVRHVTLLFLLGIGWIRVQAQADYPWKRTGDELYAQEAFGEAELAYRRALEARSSPDSRYNLGNSLYRQERLEEAIAAYKESIGQTEDKDLKADGYFNLGNAFFEKQDYAQSAGAYKEALKLRPEDEAARQNLMMALRKLKEQQQARQQQQQQQQEESKQDPSRQPQPQQDPADQQQASDPGGESGERQQEPEGSSERPLNEQEARDILKAIEREDQRVQEKLKKQKGSKPPPVKDW